MKIADILKACSGGVMPSVKTKKPVKDAKSDVGQVVMIRQSSVIDHFGVWVQFPGLEIETFFKEGDGDNKHINYMDELEFPV